MLPWVTMFITAVGSKPEYLRRHAKAELEVETMEECSLHACFQDQLALEGSTALLNIPNQEARQC